MTTIAQAFPVVAIYPEPGAPWPGSDPYAFDNAVDLDMFYVDAFMGVDHETGFIVNHDRAVAAYRDDLVYGRHVIPVRFEDIDLDNPCGWCGWDEVSSDVHAEDCGR